MRSGGTTGDAGDPSSQTAPAETLTTAASENAARTTSSAEYIVEEIRRHRLGAAIVALFAALALSAGAFGLYRLFGRGQSAPFQTMQLTRLSDTSQAVEAAVSPRGDFVVFVKEEAGRPEPLAQADFGRQQRADSLRPPKGCATPPPSSRARAT
jgi:hypothetical protein